MQGKAYASRAFRSSMLNLAQAQDEGKLASCRQRCFKVQPSGRYRSTLYLNTGLMTQSASRYRPS